MPPLHAVLFRPTVGPQPPPTLAKPSVPKNKTKQVLSCAVLSVACFTPFYVYSDISGGGLRRPTKQFAPKNGVFAVSNPPLILLYPIYIIPPNIYTNLCRESCCPVHRCRPLLPPCVSPGRGGGAPSLQPRRAQQVLLRDFCCLSPLCSRPAVV